MDRRRLKFLLLGLGILATMAFMLKVGISQTGGLVYYLTVHEYVESGAKAGERFRVNGVVKAGSIERMPTGQDVRFVMTDGKAALPVSYHGIVPDTFVDEADVVVEGSRLPDGTFEASTLLAKCPSKYEAKAQAGEENPHMDGRSAR